MEEKSKKKLPLMLAPMCLEHRVASCCFWEWNILGNNPIVININYSHCI